MCSWPTWGAGTIDRVSLPTGGGQANDRSYSPSISADGRMVAFASFATNVVEATPTGCSTCSSTGETRRRRPGCRSGPTAPKGTG